MSIKEKVIRLFRDLREEITLRLKLYSLIRKGLIGFIIISLVNVIISQLFDTPKMYGIARSNREAVIRYELMSDKIRIAEQKLAEIKHRDNNVYRMLFSADTTTSVILPYADSKYAALQEDEYAALMTDTWHKLDAFAQDLYYESLSFDQLQALAKNKEQLSSAIPAIWPVDRRQLRALYAFGWRIHPIYKRRIFHKGVDMACDVGVPVFAAGDAVVEKTDMGQRHVGYGQQILLDHEYGYKTRYAHLSKILVKPGEKIYRGQIIGLVGNTGGTTGPHLHYEVIYMGQVVNPVNYFDKNMTVEEYRTITEGMKESDLEVVNR